MLHLHHLGLWLLLLAAHIHLLHALLHHLHLLLHHLHLRGGVASLVRGRHHAWHAWLLLLVRLLGRLVLLLDERVERIVHVEVLVLHGLWLEAGERGLEAAPTWRRWILLGSLGGCDDWLRG